MTGKEASCGKVFKGMFVISKDRWGGLKLESIMEKDLARMSPAQRVGDLRVGGETPKNGRGVLAEVHLWLRRKKVAPPLTPVKKSQIRERVSGEGQRRNGTKIGKRGKEREKKYRAEAGGRMMKKEKGAERGRGGNTNVPTARGARTSAEKKGGGPNKWGGYQDTKVRGIWSY